MAEWPGRVTCAWGGGGKQRLGPGSERWGLGLRLPAGESFLPRARKRYDVQCYIMLTQIEAI